MLSATVKGVATVDSELHLPPSTIVFRLLLALRLFCHDMTVLLNQGKPSQINQGVSDNLEISSEPFFYLSVFAD